MLVGLFCVQSETSYHKHQVHTSSWICTFLLLLRRILIRAWLTEVPFEAARFDDSFSSSDQLQLDFEDHLDQTVVQTFQKAPAVLGAAEVGRVALGSNFVEPQDLDFLHHHNTQEVGQFYYLLPPLLPFCTWQEL
ncbi:unnamed protein product [Moneuplotes crassus]|uniref:Uncharacterized protein n=1 Tax=Euplotes crassus TaxID=5936 RepID=A0AAD1XP29_EUPCR|nr:unnamed protein product [Moneuplotes crassus]